MLHILLLILKIIGIILAILIGCIILFLCLVVFVPVRYRIELNRTEGEGNPPIEVKAKITWLLHFVNIKILYPADIYLRVRILFITVFRLPMKHKKEKKEKKALKDNTETIQHEQECAENASREIKTETKIEKENERENEIENEIENETENETQNTSNKLSIKGKLEKIWSIFKNIWYTIKGICDKIKDILENIEYYLDIIKSETFKQAFSLCKGELGDIFNYIKPRKYKADLIIGMDDPAATGQILSYYGMLYPLIGSHVTITGDFENKRIEGSGLIIGKIKFFTFLKALIRIYFSKDIRKLLKQFKKEDA